MDWLASLLGGMGPGAMAGMGELGDLMMPAGAGAPPGAGMAAGFELPESKPGTRFGVVPGGMADRILGPLSPAIPQPPTTAAPPGTVNTSGKGDFGGPSSPTAQPMGSPGTVGGTNLAAMPSWVQSVAAGGFGLPKSGLGGGGPAARPGVPEGGGGQVGGAPSPGEAVPAPRPRPAEAGAPAKQPNDFGDRLVKALAAIRPPNTPEVRPTSLSQPRGSFNPSGGIQKLLQLALVPQGGVSPLALHLGGGRRGY